MNTFNMTCEAVEATLPDYMDETLEGWVRSSVEEHLSQCLRCAALVRDLRNIEREAGVLPDLVPVRDLWPGIENRIGTPVMAFAPVPVGEIEPAAMVDERGPAVGIENARPIDSPPAVLPIDSRRRERSLFPLWMGAAAAALVVLTAGTTYLLTSRAVKSAAPGNFVTVTPATPAQVVSEPRGQPAGTERESTNGDDPIEPGPPAGPGAVPRGSTPPASRAAQAVLVRRSATEVVYDREIDMLQSIMRWRKADLDPATAAIIENNLRIIDAAIAQSRAALRRDPASSMLSEKLTHALDKKVELLRTAAMLPAST